MSVFPASSTPLPTDLEVLARAAGENFPVALRVLPSALRSDLSDIYGFARLVDQIGDDYAGDRMAALDRVTADLQAALAGTPAASAPLVDRAAKVVLRHGIDPAPLFALIAANRADQEVTAYPTFADLAGYCALSANPVGRLVLGVFDVSTPERVRMSDSVCTGLQLVEHWQDMAEDARRGRVYVPGEDLERFGVDPGELMLPAGGPGSSRLRALMAFEASRARRLLAAGGPLVASLGGWARVAVAGYVAGGGAALDAVARVGFDPRDGAPRASRWRTLRRGVALLVGSGREAR